MMSIRERVGPRHAPGTFAGGLAGLYDKRTLSQTSRDVEETIKYEANKKSIKAGMVRWAKSRGDINYP